MSGEKKRKPASRPQGETPEAPFVPGFRAAGVHAGIKKKRLPDLALLVSDPPARAAGIFTRNRIQAPAVRVSRERVRAGLCQAVLINSGNANACTGDRGMKDALDMSRWTAEALRAPDRNVLVASTGVIGEFLPMDRIRSALPNLVRDLRPEGLGAAAEAIRTTDRLEKHAWKQTVVGGKKTTLFGMAKGAGMICPRMATMLAFFVTDLNAPVTALRSLLKEGAASSFNRIHVDGDASTNDTVLLLANGRAGTPPASRGTREYEAFAAMLFPMMQELAYRIVQDGEGATKVVEIAIQGAKTDADARRFAYHLAGSALVKTSFFGEDPNWGRLMVALGDTGPRLDPETIDIFYNRTPLVRNGVSVGARQYPKVQEVLRKDFFTVSIHLHQGQGSCSILTSDLTHDYVTLNASYRS
jgi:glutamate N-acetyltransferase / amino-acid N-acetyltransferase